MSKCNFNLVNGGVYDLSREVLLTISIGNETQVINIDQTIYL